MGNGPKVEWDMNDMERALRALQSETDLADRDELTSNARTFLKAIVYNTPKDEGTARAGWWPSWRLLGMAGTPGTKLREGWHRFKDQKNRSYQAAGNVIDGRRNRGEQFVEYSNRTVVIQRNKKRVAYPYVLNAKMHYMEAASLEAAWKFTRAHERLLAKHSAR